MALFWCPLSTDARERACACVCRPIDGFLPAPWRDSIHHVTSPSPPVATIRPQYVLAWRPCSIAPLLNAVTLSFFSFLFPSGGAHAWLLPEGLQPHPTFYYLPFSRRPVCSFVVHGPWTRQPAFLYPNPCHPQHIAHHPSTMRPTGACRSLRYRSAGFFSTHLRL
jgi:hypothetical protein